MLITMVQNHSKVPTMPVAQARTAQGKKLLPFFSLDLPNPQRNSRAPWDTRVNPPTLLLLFPPQLDGSLCFPAASPLLRRGHLDPGQGGKAVTLSFPSPPPQNRPMKRGSRRKRTKTGVKKVGERERLEEQPALGEEREGTFPAPGRKTYILSPAWWLSLLKCT